MNNKDTQKKKTSEHQIGFEPTNIRVLEQMI